MQTLTVQNDGSLMLSVVPREGVWQYHTLLRVPMAHCKTTIECYFHCFFSIKVKILFRFLSFSKNSYTCRSIVSVKWCRANIWKAQNIYFYLPISFYTKVAYNTSLGDLSISIHIVHLHLKIAIRYAKLWTHHNLL